MTQAWTYLTLLIVIYLVYFVDLGAPLKPKQEAGQESREESANRRIILLGLIGGFSIALPALAITMLAFVTAFPHFLESLKGAREEPELAGLLFGGQVLSLDSSADQLPSLYVVGLDISKSIIIGAGEAPVREVFNFVDLMFEGDPEKVLSPFVESRDDYWSHVIGEIHPTLVQKKGALADTPPKSFAAEFRQAVTQYLKEERQSRNSTDILGFLSTAVGDVQAVPDKYAHVTIVLFSDFLQDPSGQSIVAEKPFADAQAYSEVKGKIQKLMNDLEELGNVHILGVYVSPAGRELQEGIDIRPYMRPYSASGLWRELSIEEFSAGDMEHKKALIGFNIYREKKYGEPLFLKYQVAPWRTVASKISLPQDGAYDGILLGLRASLGGDRSLPSVRVALGEGGKAPTVLSIGGREPNFEIRERKVSAGTLLSASLQSKLDVSRFAECELLVAAPSHSVVHSISVVILPSIGDLPMKIFRLALQFIGLVLIVLSIGVLGLDKHLRKWDSLLAAKLGALNPARWNR